MLTDNEVSAFTGAEDMRYGEAFEAQHAPMPNRRQWQMTAVDGTEVVTIWLDRLDHDDLTADADLNANALPRFGIGQLVRAVVVAPEDVERLDGSRVRRAWPDHRHMWRIVDIEGTVLKLRAEESLSLDAALHEAQRLASQLKAALDEIQVRVREIGKS